MNLDGKKCALATGAAFAVLWIICSVLVLVFPGPAMWVSGHMIHADFSAVNWTLTFGGFLTGLVAWSLLAALTAWLIAVFYNRCAE